MDLPAALRPAILVVEDSASLRELLTQLLSGEGYHVLGAAGTDDALAIAATQPLALVLLDWGLPGRDGLEMLRDLRARGMATPVLMLTARDGVPDRVAGLDAGADDYIAKPFDNDELLARVRALLRRSPARVAPAVRVDDLTLDPIARSARRGDRVVSLTQREYALLAVLMAHAGRTLSRRDLAEQAWRQELEDTRSTNIVDVYVAYLRRKIEGPHDTPLLHTVRGVGYVLRSSARN